MDTRIRQIIAIIGSFVCVIVKGSPLINYTTDQIVSSHDYPQTYSPGDTRTWVWTQSDGIWGVKFLDLDLTGTDALILRDSHGTIIYQSDVPKTRFDTHGSWLNITFYSDNSVPKGRGFKVDVRHGASKDDLNFKFHEVNPPPEPESTADLDLILPLLLTIALIVLLLFLAILSWFMCQRRRRRTQQQVSLSVNMQGGIRRDSGVRYTRKPSTQSQSEEPSPSKKTNLARSNSNRSWMLRAELSSTTTQNNAPTTSSTVRCNGNVQVVTTPNLYTPMETVANEQDNGRANQAQGFRSRVPTLENVPEDKLMAVVPVIPDNSLKDDGYMGPSSLSTEDSYLNCGAVVRGQPHSGICEAGYQNITLTGSVDIS